jgi:succinate dehydrogenase/fumarate reductase flavoprotein subunit
MSSIIISNPDAVVVGTGLAGLTVAYHILSRGGSCVVLEKEARVGGNSAKASSGINSSAKQKEGNNGIDSFRRDTLQSAGVPVLSPAESSSSSSSENLEEAKHELIDILCDQSEAAISFLTETIGADLSELGQLGGHSAPRTHRPKNGAVGWELISKFQAKLDEFPKERLQIVTNCKVTDITRDDVTGDVTGVSYELESKDSNDSIIQRTISSPTVVLCTGGFAADRSDGSLISKHQPQFLKMATTAGAFSTGDGIHLATKIGADTIDMEKLQIHPTGFVDPKDPDSSSKFLAAELMRGIGGILLTDEGKR